MAAPLVLGAAAAIARQQALRGVGKLTTNPMYKGMGADPFMRALPYMVGGTMMAGPAMYTAVPYLAKEKYKADQQAKQHAADVAQYYNTHAGQESMKRSHANSREMLPIGTEGYAAGGLVGENMIYDTESLDLPRGLQNLMPGGTQMNNRAYAATNPAQGNNNAPALDFRNQPTPSYALGGQVGQDGMPVAPGGMPPGGAPQGAGLQSPGNIQPGAPMDPKMMELELQKFMRDNPEQVAQIKQVVIELLQSGELTQDELNMAVQLATVALQNPDMYPQVRQFAIQQGIVDEGDLDTEYDQGLIFVLLLAAKAAQQETGGNFMEGGEITKGTGPTADDVSIKVSKGEYVIPADVVKAKGTDFFDKMIDPKGGSKA